MIYLHIAIVSFLVLIFWRGTELIIDKTKISSALKEENESLKEENESLKDTLNISYHEIRPLVGTVEMHTFETLEDVQYVDMFKYTKSGDTTYLEKEALDRISSHFKDALFEKAKNYIFYEHDYNPVSGIYKIRAKLDCLFK